MVTSRIRWRHLAMAFVLWAVPALLNACGPVKPAKVSGPIIAPYWQINAIAPSSDGTLLLELREGQAFNRGRDDTDWNAFESFAWDSKHNKVRLRLRGAARPCFCRNATAVRALVGKRGLVEYDISSGNKVGRWSLPLDETPDVGMYSFWSLNPVNYLTNSDQGNVVYSSTYRTLARTRLDKPQEQKVEVSEQGAADICNLTFVPGGRLVLVCTAGEESTTRNDIPRTVLNYAFYDDKLTKSVSWQLKKLWLRHHSLQLSPNGALIACRFDYILADASYEVIDYELHRAMTGDKVCSVELLRFRTSDGRFLSTLPENDAQIAFSPDSTKLAIVSNPDEIEIRSVPAGQLLNTLRMPKAQITALAFSSDGAMLYAGTGSREDFDLYEWKDGLKGGLSTVAKSHMRQYLTNPTLKTTKMP